MNLFFFTIFVRRERKFLKKYFVCKWNIVENLIEVFNTVCYIR